MHIIELHSLNNELIYINTDKILEIYEWINGEREIIGSFIVLDGNIETEVKETPLEIIKIAHAILHKSKREGE